jgi:predicted Zn-dependent protease
MPPVQQTPIVNKDHHNKSLFFSALIISLAILIFAIWYGYDMQAQQARDVETARLINQTALTTTDDTANWKTYRNEKLGFEIKYPPEWKIDALRSNRAKSGSDLVFDIGLAGHNHEGVRVDISSSTVDEWVSKLDKKVIIEISDFIVGGQPAKRVDTSEFAGTLIVTKFNDRLYLFYTMGKMIDNGVLSTFKFISTSTPR